MSQNLRPNKYAKPCVVCGNRVEAGAGFIIPRNPSAGGGWDVICSTDVTSIAAAARTRLPAAPAVVLPTSAAPRFRRHEEVFLDTDAQAPVFTRPIEPPAHHVTVRAANGQVYYGVAPGTYTITLPNGAYRTFRIRVQGSDEDFAPGKAIIEHLSGSSNTSDYTPFAFLGGREGTSLYPWKRFLGSEALLADARYFLSHLSEAEVARNCIRCNALLTTPESLAAGIGPTCERKGW